MIQWCLNLKLLLSAVYHSLRTEGFIKLPSERTLRDYTHYIKSEAGFSAELDQLLADEFRVDTLPDWKQYVVLIIIRQDESEGESRVRQESDQSNKVRGHGCHKQSSSRLGEKYLQISSILQLHPTCLF